MGAAAKPRKKQLNLVRIRYGDPLVTFAGVQNEGELVRLTDWTDDFTHLGQVYTSTPDLEIDNPPLTGGFSERPCKIRMGENAFALLATNLEDVGTIEVKILQVLDPKSGDASEVRHIWEGWMIHGTRNDDGKAGRFAFTAVTWKELIKDVRPSKPMMHQCWNQFGRPGCFFNVEAHAQTGVLDSRDGHNVVVTGLPAAPSDRWYHRGRLRRNGLEFTVRDWDGAADPEMFRLTRRVPASWVGQEVVALPGCDYTRKKCDEDFDNLENINAVGIKAPARHVNLELP